MDDDRFLTIVTPHIPSMVRVATALVGATEAEDVAQETLTRAWQSWRSLRAEHAARAWLLRITINICRNLHRGQSGINTAAFSSLDDDMMVSAIESRQPLEADPGNRAATMDLRDAIGALPEDLRLVIALRYYAGMDASEIGHLITIPPATIRTRLRRALTLLRARLGDQPLPSREEGANAGH
ncbi:MAG TPA: sigma-70 family RNA polymerase sigma factor [Ktedonobacterales bacterium]|nr:sigma-70 family RNA polymerase sigma factor [Ktedonobacterales bacterium]